MDIASAHSLWGIDLSDREKSNSIYREEHGPGCTSRKANFDHRAMDEVKREETEVWERNWKAQGELDE